jgi:hypothetical protein
MLREAVWQEFSLLIMIRARPRDTLFCTAPVITSDRHRNLDAASRACLQYCHDVVILGETVPNTDRVAIAAAAKQMGAIVISLYTPSTQRLPVADYEVDSSEGNRRLLDILDVALKQAIKAAGSIQGSVA